MKRHLSCGDMVLSLHSFNILLKLKTSKRSTEREKKNSLSTQTRSTSRNQGKVHYSVCHQII